MQQYELSALPSLGESPFAAADAGTLIPLRSLAAELMNSQQVQMDHQQQLQEAMQSAMAQSSAAQELVQPVSAQELVQPATVQLAAAEAESGSASDGNSSSIDAVAVDS